jgi:hypothetical protein
VILPFGGGGPASGRAGGGGIFLLDGSVNGPLPVWSGAGTLAGGFGGTKSGRPSLAFGAFVPNGLRWSVGFSATITPVQRG